MSSPNPVQAGYEFDLLSGSWINPITGEIWDDYISDVEPVLISDAQNSAALDEASAEALRRAGLENSPRGTWTGADAANFTKQLRNVILSNPQAFTAETVAIAERINLSRVDDYAMSDPNKLIHPSEIIVTLTDWIAEPVQLLQPIAQLPGKLVTTANQILQSAERLIQGVTNTASLGPVLIPIFAVAAVYFLARNAGRDATSLFR